MISFTHRWPLNLFFSIIEHFSIFNVLFIKNLRKGWLLWANFWINFVLGTKNVVRDIRESVWDSVKDFKLVYCKCWKAKSFVRHKSSRKRMLEIARLKNEACKSAAAMVLTELVDSDDKKPRLGKTREWIKKRRETGYLQNIFQELKFEDRMGFQDMFDNWMSLSLSLSLLYCKTENWMNTITSCCF